MTRMIMEFYRQTDGHRRPSCTAAERADRQKGTMMKRRIREMSFAVGLVTVVASAAVAEFPRSPLRRCGADAVVAGTVCLDKYEESVWRVPNATTTNASLVAKIQQGRATEADLTAGGATQLGTQGDDYTRCANNGQTCANDIYAVSLPSQIPAASITWFQAHEACANAAKRLPTNAEWQVGANGTPDPGPDNGTTDCNTENAGALSLTGARAACVSTRGAFDMVGNLAEWVSDWVPAPTTCPGWANFSNDDMCLSGASTTTNGPGALVRGGAFASLGGASAGPLAIHVFQPSHAANFVGFRCAR